MVASGALKLLLVEDNAIDRRATLRALESLDRAHSVAVAEDGDAALEHLAGPDPYPDLVLLDLNLPGRDGHDVLTAMAEHPEWKRIPVVVLTTSTNEADITKAYELSANAFVSKPLDLAGWRETIRRIDDFWLSLAELPRR